MSICVFVLISIYTSSEQCQREIDEVLGAREHVTYEDRNAMPFVQAVIHEGQRVGDIVPLSMFHTARTDIQLQGYSIPKVAFNYCVATNVSLHQRCRVNMAHKTGIEERV